MKNYQEKIFVITICGNYKLFPSSYFSSYKEQFLMAREYVLFWNLGLVLDWLKLPDWYR